MELSLEGKIAFIAGGSSGIGLETAKLLSKEGCKTIINGRDKDSLGKAFDFNNFDLKISADLSNPLQSKNTIEQIISKFGKLDILIFCIGSGKSVPSGEESYEEWLRVFNNNFFSATNIIKDATEHLANTSGKIVCISSICGNKQINGAPATYSSAKAALNKYVKSISGCLAKKKININAISPGNVDTENSIWRYKSKFDPDGLKSYLQKNVPLERLASPSEIASLAVYLASPLASFTTGSIWNIDGGQET